MAVVGTAYVNVRAITDQLKGDIEKSLSSSSSSAKAAGADAGKNFREGFRSESAAPDIDFGNAERSASDAGQRIGQNLQNSLDTYKFGLPDIDTSGATQGLEDAGRAAGQDLERGLSDALPDIENTASKAGGNASNGFLSSFESNTRGGMSRILSIVSILGPALIILVSALSALASGLFAVASAAAPAAAGLAVLPGLAIAAAGAFGVLKLGFSGIGAAVKAGLAPVTGAGASAAKAANTAASSADAIARAQEGLARSQEQNSKAIVDADRRVEDSKRSLTNTLLDVTRSQQSSDRSVFLANRALADAQTAATTAQQKVNAARKEAVQQMIDLKFQLESGALSEESAAINLEKARRQLVLLQGLPPDNLLRREAELSYKQAQLNVEKTADAYKQTQEAAKDNAKTTVEGSDNVVKAKNDELKAQRDLADAQYNAALARQKADDSERDNIEKVALARRAVADAEQDRAQVTVDNARRTADAQRALESALRGSAAAASGGAGGVNKFNQALDKLSPAAQAFVKYLISIKSKLDDLKSAAAEGILPGAQAGLESIINGGFFDVILRGVSQISKAVGDVFVSFGKLTETPFFQGAFTDIFGSSAKLVGDFGKTLENVITIVLAITRAAIPMTEEFSKFITTVTGNWANDAAANGDKMTKFFERSSTVAKQLGTIISNVAVGIFRLGQTAAPAGQTLLDSFEKATEKFKELTTGDANQKKFKDFFAGVATNVQALGRLFDAIVVSIAKLGDDPGIAKLADTITTTFIPVFDRLASSINDKAGPAFGKLVEAVSGFLTAVQDSPALTIFLTIMTGFFDALTAFANNPAGKVVIFTLASIVASMKALSIIKKLTFIEPLLAGLSKIDKFAKGGGLAAYFKSAGDAAKNVNVPDIEGTGGGAAGEPNVNGFTENMARLARQFAITGEAKDKFIANLVRLQTQFAKMSVGGPAGTAAGRTNALKPTPGAGASALPDVDSFVATGSSKKAAAEAAEGLEKVAASGGKVSKIFGPLKGLAAGLSTALFGVEAATLAALAPFIAVAAAIAAVVLVVKLAYDRSETFRNAVDTKLRPAITKLGTALAPIIAVVKKFAEEGLKKIGDFLGNYVVPALADFISFIADHLPQAIAIVSGPLGFTVALIFNLADAATVAYKAIKDFVENAIKKIKEFANIARVGLSGIWGFVTNGLDGAKNSISDGIKDIGQFFVGIGDGISKIAGNVFKFLSDNFGGVRDFLKGQLDITIKFYTNLGKRIADVAGDVFKWLRDRMIQVRDYVRDRLSEIVNGWATIGSRIAKAAGDVFLYIRAKINEARDYVGLRVSELVGKFVGISSSIAARAGDIFGIVKTKIVEARDWVASRLSEVIGLFTGGFGGSGSMAARIANAASGMWNGISTAFRSMINGIIRLWNNLSFSLPSVDVPGIGKIGGFTLSTPDIPYLAKGGTIKPSPGGTLARIAEAGRSERVTPLGPDGMSDGERAILAAIGSTGGRPIEIKVYAAPGMNVPELAKAVSRELAFTFGS